MEVPKRIAQILINSLKGGVVPRVGLPYITVGRKEEIDALLKDIEMIEAGGASFRFLVGKYGSGKSFLLQTIRNYAMGKNFAVVDADLSPERRLQGSRGQGLATYKELMRNLSTKTKPEGGALPLILDRWISHVQQQVLTESGLASTEPAFYAAVEKKIYEVIFSLNELVHGFDFARLLAIYYRSYVDGEEEKKACVLKWFRGEYTTKTEAKAELGVSQIITDDDWYEYLKIFAQFLKQAGYAGLLIFIDELVNIYKIPNAITRQYNYEKILMMYNDALQGKASGLGILMCGTPQSMEDTRRGIYSYEALRSRLAQSRYVVGQKDLLSPVISLLPLTYEELLILTEKLTSIHARLYEYEEQLTQEERVYFIETEFGRIGADIHITPREVIRDFIAVLDILMQSPDCSLQALLGSSDFVYAKGGVEEEVPSAFAEFTL